MAILEHFPGTDKVNEIHLSIGRQTAFEVRKHVACTGWLPARKVVSMTTSKDFNGLDYDNMDRIAHALMELFVEGPAPGLPKKLITNDTSLRTLLRAKVWRTQSQSWY